MSDRLVFKDPPESVPELVDRLSRMTHEAFIRAWTDEPNRIPAIEDSMNALHVWEFLSDAGITWPDWVSAALAGVHYGPSQG